MSKKQKGPTSIRLDDETNEKIKKKSLMTGKSEAEIIRELMHIGLSLDELEEETKKPEVKKPEVKKPEIKKEAYKFDPSNFIITPEEAAKLPPDFDPRALIKSLYAQKEDSPPIKPPISINNDDEYVKKWANPVTWPEKYPPGYNFILEEPIADWDCLKGPENKEARMEQRRYLRYEFHYNVKDFVELKYNYIHPLYGATLEEAKEMGMEDEFHKIIEKIKKQGWSNALRSSLSAEYDHTELSYNIEPDKLPEKSMALPNVTRYKGYMSGSGDGTTKLGKIFVLPVGEVVWGDQVEAWFCGWEHFEYLKSLCKPWEMNGFKLRYGVPLDDNYFGTNLRWCPSTRMVPGVRGDRLVWFDIINPQDALDYMILDTAIPVAPYWINLERYNKDLIYQEACNKAEELFKYYFLNKERKGRPYNVADYM